MTVYGGFDPATFQAWSLNLFADIFTTPGIARGFQVTQTSVPSMAVQVTLDSVANDAVCYFSTGAWMRVDAVTQFSISSNTSGSTRTDAVVAQVDPTNAGNLSLSVQANWSQGFNPTNVNQLVIALISVPNNATSIVNANITMTSKVAQVTGAGGSSSMTASDGVGLAVQDNSSSSTLTLVTTGLTTGVGRNIVIQTTDASSIGHQFTFGSDGSYQVPGASTFNSSGVTGINAATFIGGSGGNAIRVRPSITDTLHDFYINASPTGLAIWDGNGGNYALLGATATQRIVTMRSVGGGIAGSINWVGTSDPGGAAGEGDTWAAG